MRIGQMVSRVLMGALSFLVFSTAYSAALTLSRVKDGVKTETYQGLKVYRDAVNPIVLPQDAPFALKYLIKNNIKKAITLKFTITNASLSAIGSNCSYKLAKVNSTCFLYFKADPKILFKSYPANVLTSVKITAYDSSLKSNTGIDTLVLNKIGLSKITPTASTLSLPRGQGTSFKALGTYSSKFSRSDISYAGTPVDISKYMQWKSSAPAVALINATSGVVTTNKNSTIGNTIITATLTSLNGPLTSAAVTLSVTQPKITAITLTPSKPSLFISDKQNFVAQATYSDGTTGVDVTKKVLWTTDKPAIATFNSAIGYEGQVIGLSAGTVNVNASLEGATGTTVLTVKSPSVTSLSIAANTKDSTNNNLVNGTLSGGLTQSFSVTPTYDALSYKEPITGVTWAVIPDTGSASVSQAGVVTAGAKGRVTISASYSYTDLNNKKQTINASIPLNIGDPVLMGVSITPTSASIEQKKTQQYVATATYSYGEPKAINVTWSSSAPDIVSIDSQGLATALSRTDKTAASTQIQASYTNPASGALVSISPVTLTVNPLVVDKLTIDTVKSIGLGETKPISITATYSNGDTQDITSDTSNLTVTYSGTVSVNQAEGTVTGINTGVSGSITAHWGSINSTPFYITVTPPTLTSLVLSQDKPNPTAVAGGQPFKLSVSGIYSDSATPRALDAADQDNLVWKSNNTALASIDKNSGLISIPFSRTAPLAPVSISATSGTASGSVPLTITAPSLVSIVVSPAQAPASMVAGALEPKVFTAQAKYSNDPAKLVSLDSSDTLSWSVSDAQGVAIDPSIVSIDSNGQVTVPFSKTAPSSVVVSAQSGDISGKATLTITPPALLAIELTAVGNNTNPLRILAGQSQSLSIKGKYSNDPNTLRALDASEQLNWSILSGDGTLASNNSIADNTVTLPFSKSPANRLSVQVVNTAANTLTIPGTITLNVLAPVLQSISISPESASMIAGEQPKQFTLMGTYSNDPNTPRALDGSDTVKWSLTNRDGDTVAPTVASIDSTGKLTVPFSTLAPVSPLTITASSGTVSSGTATVSINKPTLKSLSITPANSSIEKNVNQLFTVLGTYDSGTQDMSSNVLWTSSSSVVYIDPITGLAKPNSPGTVTITATDTKSGIFTNTQLTVNTPVVTSLTVAPETSNASTNNMLIVGDSASLNAGLTQAFTAKATYSDGSKGSLFTGVVWSVTPSDNASINPSTGLLTARKAGKVTVQASYTNSVSSNSTTQPTTQTTSYTVTISPPKPTGIIIAPLSSSIEQNATQSYTVTQTFSDNTSIILKPSDVQWTSNTAVATVDTTGTQAKAIPAAPSYSASASSTQITASLPNPNDAANPFSASSTLNINKPAVMLLSISVPSTTIKKGDTQTINVIATYSNGQTRVLPYSEVTFSTSKGSIAVSSSTDSSITGNLTGVSVASSDEIYASMNGNPVLPATVSISVTPATLSSVIIRASGNTTNSIYAGQPQTFTVTQGYYTDDINTARPLNADDASAVTFQTTPSITGVTISSTGVLTSTSASSGSVTITALVKGVAKGSTSLTINPVTLSTITITPATPATVIKGKTLQFSATGTNSDGTTTQDLSVTWRAISSATATGTANISKTGLLTADKPGTVIVQASSGAIHKEVELTVEAVALDQYKVTCSPSTVAAGVAVTCSAQGINNDGTTSTSTESLNWKSSAGSFTSTATTVTTKFDNAGQVTITATGSVSGKSGTATLTVTQPSLTAISIAPGSPNNLTDTSSIIAGKSQPFTIKATYSLASYAPAISGVNWSMTSTPATGVATLSDTGVLNTTSAGTVIIKASYTDSNNIQKIDQYTVTVTAPVLTKIEVSTSTASIAAGQSTSFTAKGTYSNLTTNPNLPVSWETTSGTIDSNGLLSIDFAQSPSINQATITATASGVSGTKSINITAPVLKSITITPESANLYVDGPAQTFTAMGTYEYIGAKPISSGIAWTAPSTGLNISGTSSAQVTASSSGSGKSIKATVGTVSGTASINVYKANVTLTVPSVVSFTPNMKVRTITIKNNTSDIASGVKILDLLPAGISKTNDNCTAPVSSTSSCSVTLTMDPNSFDKTANNQIIINNSDSNPNASALESKILLTNSIPWEPDGAVNSTVIDEENARVYLGGEFSAIGVKTGGGSLIDGETGLPNGIYPKINGMVHASISDGNNGWYIGGQFTITDKDITYTNLAHIKADSGLDASWRPTTNKAVLALAMASNGTVFAGGEFTVVNGSSVSYLVRINADGGITKYDSGANITYSGIKNGTVRALALNGDTLYVGGDFSKKEPTPSSYNYIAALNVRTNTLSALSAEPDAAVNALAFSTPRLFVGGSFTKVGSASHQRVAVFDVVTDSKGALATADLGVTNGSVNAIAANASHVYIGGTFTSVNGNPRNRIASFSVTGALTDTSSFLNPGTGTAGVSYSTSAAAEVNALSLSNSTLYVGGDFDRITSGGGTLVRYRVAALDLNSSRVTVEPWTPYIDQKVSALAINTNNSGIDSVYAGGSFSMVGKARSRIAALDLYSGVPIDSWKPSITGGAGVNAMVLDKNVTPNLLYVGGSFTAVNGTDKKYLAALNLTDGAPIGAWTPTTNNTVRAMALYPNDPSLPKTGDSGGTGGNGLFIGGDFTEVNGVRQLHVALLNSKGKSNTNWGTRFETSHPVYALLYYTGTNNGTPIERLYVGGNFTSLGNRTTLYGLAVVNIPTKAEWNQGQEININYAFRTDGVAANNKIYALAREGNTLHIGGALHSSNGYNYARLNATNGLNAGGVYNLNGQVNSLALGIGNIYIGGAFNTLGGMNANKYVAIGIVPDNYQIGWRNSCPIPTGILNDIKSIATSGNLVIVGGMWMNTVNP